MRYQLWERCPHTFSESWKDKAENTKAEISESNNELSFIDCFYFKEWKLIGVLTKFEKRKPAISCELFYFKFVMQKLKTFSLHSRVRHIRGATAFINYNILLCTI